ncbi:MAG: hypothetical protein N3D74_04565 [Caldisericia bacterium]|nr:hypothetical protein [Caldisericia bacterium]
MSISELIRKEVKILAYEGKDINVRKISRKYKCSPSLVVKNIYKVQKEEELKHITKFGVKGKVNLLIIDFNLECSPLKCSPIENSLNQPSFQKGEHLIENPNENSLHKCSLSKLSSTQLFSQKGEHSPQFFKKEKEKVSYKLLKEKEKNIINEKFINKFLEFQQIETLSLPKYEKEIIKTFYKYGGKIREKDLPYIKGILSFSTPRQFEAILLKTIKEKKGEVPNIPYLYEISKRMNLKWREKEKTPKLFSKKDSGLIENTQEEVITFSFKGFTGEEAVKEFFGEC